MHSVTTSVTLHELLSHSDTKTNRTQRTCRYLLLRSKPNTKLKKTAMGCISTILLYGHIGLKNEILSERLDVAENLHVLVLH